jgi:hypothetical protein
MLAGTFGIGEEHVVMRASQRLEDPLRLAAERHAVLSF